jgi:cysteine desulfurase
MKLSDCRSKDFSLSLPFMTKPIYLDYAATTPLDEAVLDAMRPYFSAQFGNPASALHAYGWEAEEAVAKARNTVAGCLGTKAKEIFFTSGATESNNWALRGVVEHLKLASFEKIHVLTSPVEHQSIIQILQHLQALGDIELEFVKINQCGQIILQDLKQRIRSNTRLMSFMWANNELGSLNPIKEIGALARQHAIFFHSDATQAVGKLHVDLQNLPVDLLSFSGHKIYGPKGTGVLYLRGQIQLAPLLFGGAQERGLRSGTVNVPGVVGLATALEKALGLRNAEQERSLHLRKSFLHQLNALKVRYQLNGHNEETLAQIINLTLPDLKDTAHFPGLAISKGSACHSGGKSLSHVLAAIGVDEAAAEKTLRISFGRQTTLADLEKTALAIEKHSK